MLVGRVSPLRLVGRKLCPLFVQERPQSALAQSIFDLLGADSIETRGKANSYRLKTHLYRQRSVSVRSRFAIRGHFPARNIPVTLREISSESCQFSCPPFGRNG